MRLFLSSYRAGDYSEKLVGLFGENSKVAVITNAKDYKSQEERSQSVEEILDFLKKLGFKPTEIDLRKYFSDSNFTEDDLKKYQAVWVAGGNTFILVRALNQSGARKVLGNMIRKNQIIYGGESAGAILPTPTLTGVQFGDDPNIVPEGYEKELIWEGLNLINYHIVPHYKTEWEGAEEMIAELKSNNLDYKTLTDNQAIIINGDKEEFLK
jgi:dipeptidase E